MPYWRLMYDWDNNYTKKEKRMILLTQEAIDKINWLTPWWWAEYTAGSWIVISQQNVISNTAQFNPTNAWTTWQVLKKVGNSYSRSDAEWWAMFVTQEEYDALPSSKTTDGKEYIIVDSHQTRLEWETVINMEDWGEAYLNNGWLAAAQYYYGNWDIEMREASWDTVPEWKYWYMYMYVSSPCDYFFLDTDMTKQELMDANMNEDEADKIIAWEWIVECDWEEV